MASSDEDEAKLCKVDRIYIVYDGECPFCSRYVRLLRLRKALGEVELVNARNGGPIVDELLCAGLDLDEGMVLKIGEKLYHGADCINRLALLSTRSGIFNKFNRFVFANEMVSAILYPILRAGRNGVLRILGRSKIGT